jgi:hypothetical protein
MAVMIRKASGASQEFDPGKLSASLIRSGAPADIAENIARTVEQKIQPSMKTNEIYRMAKKLMKHYNLAAGIRYSLKKAISALGPSGYPFEKYVARILKAYGYSAEVGRIISGYCVRHEVDILAKNGNEHFVIECKYHNNGGKPTDVRTALYVHSRFNDIKKARELMPEYGTDVHQGWLVTNTRCTSDAIKYAECVGLRIISWRYPEKGSLEGMIEEKRLYPVTILPSARGKALEKLFEKDWILAQDIADVEAEIFVERSGIDAHTASQLKREADALCPCVP